MIDIHKLVSIIKDNLSNDLRKSKYKNSPNEFKGYCYVAGEALYYILGGKLAGWKPMFIYHEAEPHWFIKHKDGMILDITAKQFITPIPYHKAMGKGFLTKQPSKRAAILIKKINGKMD